MKNDQTNQFLPLTPAVVHILLALAGEDLHGYGIMQEVERHSEGRYKIGPGTLYDNLQRMMDQGLVQEVSKPESSRRRYYSLSALGRGVLAADITRLERVVRDGKLRLASASPGRS